MGTNVRSGILLAVLGLWLVLRTTSQDQSGRTLVDHILTKAPDWSKAKAPTIYPSSAAGVIALTPGADPNSVQIPFPGSPVPTQPITPADTAGATPLGATALALSQQGQTIGFGQNAGVTAALAKMRAATVRIQSMGL